MSYDPRPDALAQRAYEAYCAALDRPVTDDGAWFALDPQVREAWRQVAKALTQPTTRSAR